MTKTPSEGKAPITGRSGRQRVEDRRKTKAGAKVIAKRHLDAIEHRGRVVLGDAAARYSSRHEPTRHLVAVAFRDIGEEDVRDWLGTLAEGKPPLPNPTFEVVWNQWLRLRELDKAIESAWADVELLLNDALDPPDKGFDAICGIIDEFVNEWEGMMGIEHPLGQIMRMTSPD